MDYTIKKSHLKNKFVSGFTGLALLANSILPIGCVDSVNGVKLKDPQPVGVGAYEKKDEKKDNKELYILGGLALLVGAGVGSYFLYEELSKDKDDFQLTPVTSGGGEGRSGPGGQ